MVKEIVRYYVFGAGLVALILGITAHVRIGNLSEKQKRLEEKIDKVETNTIQISNKIDGSYKELINKIDSAVNEVRNYALEARFWGANAIKVALNECEKIKKDYDKRIENIEKKVEITSKNVHKLYDWANKVTKTLKKK